MKAFIIALIASFSLLAASAAQALLITYDPGDIGSDPTLSTSFADLNGTSLPSTLELDFVFSGNKQVNVVDPGTLGFGAELLFRVDNFGGGFLAPVVFLTDIAGNNILNASSVSGRASGGNQSYSFGFELFTGLEFHGIHMSLDMSDVNPVLVTGSDLQFFGDDAVLAINEFIPPLVPGTPSIPEPGTALLIVAGLLGLTLRHRKICKDTSREGFAISRYVQRRLA